MSCQWLAGEFLGWSVRCSLAAFPTEPLVSAEIGMIPENSARRKLDKGLYEWANGLFELEILLDVNLARVDFVGWPLAKDRDVGKWAMGRRLRSVYL